jgi:DNA recombination-dependent growth factor C
VVVLTEHPKSAPSGLPVVLLDAQFDPQTWLTQWLQQRRRSRHTQPIEA